MEGASPLLAPTLTEHVPRDWTRPLPWRLGSQIYVAILGGPVAVTIIAVINAQRLRMPSPLVGLLAAIGIAVFAATLALSFAVDEDLGRLLRQLSGAAAFGLMFLVQRPHDRAHVLFSPHEDEDDDYESLWGPGVAAVLGGLLLDAFVLGALTA